MSPFAEAPPWVKALQAEIAALRTEVRIGFEAAHEARVAHQKSDDEQFRNVHSDIRDLRDAMRDQRAMYDRVDQSSRELQLSTARAGAVLAERDKQGDRRWPLVIALIGCVVTFGLGLLAMWLAK